MTGFSTHKWQSVDFFGGCFKCCLIAFYSIGLQEGQPLNTVVWYKLPFENFIRQGKNIFPIALLAPQIGNF